MICAPSQCFALALRQAQGSQPTVKRGRTRSTNCGPQVLIAAITVERSPDL
jgi:hypothetical protein